jgi:hypothetical protein
MQSCSRVKKGGWMPALVNTSESKCRKTSRKADTKPSEILEQGGAVARTVLDPGVPIRVAAYSY